MCARAGQTLPRSRDSTAVSNIDTTHDEPEHRPLTSQGLEPKPKVRAEDRDAAEDRTTVADSGGLKRRAGKISCAIVKPGTVSCRSFVYFLPSFRTFHRAIVTEPRRSLSRADHAARQE